MTVSHNWVQAQPREAAVKALTSCETLTYLVCGEGRRLSKDILINYDEIMTSSLATLLPFDRPQLLILPQNERPPLKSGPSLHLLIYCFISFS